MFLHSKVWTNLSVDNANINVRKWAQWCDTRNCLQKKSMGCEFSQFYVRSAETCFRKTANRSSCRVCAATVHGRTYKKVVEKALWTPHELWTHFWFLNFQTSSELCVLRLPRKYCGPERIWNGQHLTILGETYPITGTTLHYEHLDNCDVAAL